jgi:uncharacterized protein YgbK (DUF1537 family)
LAALRMILPGGTDLASTLVEGGMRTLQVLGVPAGLVPDDIS